MMKYRGIGIMTGTSLDGIDLVDVSFMFTKDKRWEFELNHSYCFDYDENIERELKNAYQLSAPDLIELDAKLGRYLAIKVNEFITLKGVSSSIYDFVASHGQTIFHQPKKGYTFQIGNGPELAVNTGIPSITDFRSRDIALGGNGAPLIPVADFLLFKKYASSFLNLGGFSNVSFEQDKSIHSFDICPVNSTLNHFAMKDGFAYDRDGKLGREGEINNKLLEQLNSLPYYFEKSPKSLGWEWVEHTILPKCKGINNKNVLATFYQHIGHQIGKNLDELAGKTILVTGGGARNSYLIELIKAHTSKKLIIPSEELIDFKEAIGFAFLGVLRYKNINNVWASVTGAKKNSCSGRIIQP